MQDMVGFSLKFKLSCPGSRVLLFRDGKIVFGASAHPSIRRCTHSQLP